MTIAKKLGYTLAIAAVSSLPFGAQAMKNSINIAMTLEPPGLDPRTNAAAAIGQIALYNIYENLVHINQDATFSPMLAKSWSVSADGLGYTFNLLKGVKFHDGSDFTSADVKYTFEGNAAENSKNKRKKRFVNMAKIETPGDHTVRITLKAARPMFLFQMGESTAVIVDEKSAATNATKPIGTGPFKFVSWVKGDSVVMEKNPNYRDASSVKLQKVKFRFINDQAAQIAAMMSGDLDLIPFSRAAQSLGPLKADPNFAVTFGTTEGETILSTNNKHPALSKLKVRQAIAHAIDRKKIIDGAMFGAGTPIGSHFAPHNPDYLDLTGTYPLDRKKSKMLGTSWTKGVPIEVLPLSYKPIQMTIQKRFGGTPHLRMAKAKAGPVVTDNGNFILDWVFSLDEIREQGNLIGKDDCSVWHKVNTELCCMAGVVDTGLFVNMAKVAYFGTSDGNVIQVDKRQED